MKILMASVLLLSATSCSLLKPREGQTPEQAAQSIHNLSKVATTIAIMEIYKDDVEKRVSKAKNLAFTMENTVLPLLDGEESITALIASELMDAIPEEYQLYMILAQELLSSNFTLPELETDFLSEEDTLYLKAFLTGVRDGAVAVLPKVVEEAEFNLGGGD